MNNTNTNILTAGGVLALLLVGATLIVRLTGFSTYELAISLLVLTVLGHVAIAEFRKGALRPGIRVSQQRLPRQGFRA